MYSGSGFALGLMAVAFLGACTTSPPASTMTSSTQGTTLVQIGEVMDVRDLSVHGGSSGSIGSIVGAVLGGVAGSTIGSGSGATVASIGGAVAGSMAGQHIAQSSATRQATELQVRLDNGEERTYTIEPSENFRIGDKVKIVTAHGTTRVTH